MAPGTERRVLTSDLPLAPLRVLASSRETNGLPYPIERAIRKKLPRLAASDKSSLGMRQSIEAYGLAPLDHRPQTPQMAPFFVPEHHSPALATRHSRQLDHPRHRVTQHRHTASSHSIVTPPRRTESTATGSSTRRSSVNSQPRSPNRARNPSLPDHHKSFYRPLECQWDPERESQLGDLERRSR